MSDGLKGGGGPGCIGGIPEGGRLGKFGGRPSGAPGSPPMTTGPGFARHASLEKMRARTAWWTPSKPRTLQGMGVNLMSGTWSASTNTRSW